jgi:uncharacterized membrane protein YqaE (UPF0057 family)
MHYILNLKIMKMITKSKAIALLLVTVIVGSCATNDVVSGGLFSKRKYNKGFHYNGGGKTKTSDTEASNTILKTEEVATNNSKTAEKELITIPAINIEEKTVENVVFNENKVEAVVITESKTQKSLKNTVKNTTVKPTFAQKVISKAILKKANDSKKGIDPILYIVLCIFISPVAVGLATDWNVKDVVINLLLCLTCIGGIIHAFIVCKREGVI